MIGLSVSFCIRDIADGKVAGEDVEKIIAGTRAATPEDWDHIIKDYRNIYWYGRSDEDTDLADRCEEILRGLIAAGKIEQPRLENDRRYPMLASRKHWVDTESQIKWSNKRSW